MPSIDPDPCMTSCLLATALLGHHENPRWLRARLRLSATNADGVDVERPSHARRRHRRARSNSRGAVRSDDVLLGWVWELVHAHACAARPAAAVNQCPAERHGRARLDRTIKAQHAVEDLPEDSLVFLLGSRYCETDRLTGIAWNLFGKAPTGAGRIYAICDYVHRHIAFSYQDADRQERRGRLFRKAEACAATTRIWRSHSAAA